MIMRDTKEGANTETGVLYSSNSEGNKFAISQEDINLIDDDIADVYTPNSMDFVILVNRRLVHHDEENA